MALRIPTSVLFALPKGNTSLRPSLARASTTASKTPDAPQQTSNDNAARLEDTPVIETKPKKTMTTAEKDVELMRKLAAMSDEGGAAGVEYENGKPVAMKRSVKNNMFRLI